MPNIDFSCDTHDCIFWKAGECSKSGVVTIREHYCIDFKAAFPSNQNFTTYARMREIANKALDYFGELCCGSDLYDTLRGTLGMTDEEILDADFKTLKDHMGEDDDGATSD